MARCYREPSLQALATYAPCRVCHPEPAGRPCEGAKPCHRPAHQAHPLQPQRHREGACSAPSGRGRPPPGPPGGSIRAWNCRSLSAPLCRWTQGAHTAGRQLSRQVHERRPQLDADISGPNNLEMAALSKPAGEGGAYWGLVRCSSPPSRSARRRRETGVARRVSPREPSILTGRSGCAHTCRWTQGHCRGDPRATRASRSCRIASADAPRFPPLETGST